MYKPISNYQNNKSIICSEVEARKNIVDQTYCCSKDKGCLPYSRDDCIGIYEVSRCHNVTNFGACKRNDTVVAQVCGGLQNSLFCLSGESVGRNDPHYSRFPVALEWMTNRGTEAESNSVTVCDDGTSYQLCNANATSIPNGTVAYLTCGDLFQSTYMCNWHNITNGVDLTNLPRNPLGELCGAIPSETSITKQPDNTVLAISIAAIVMAGLGIMIVAFLSIYIWRKRRTPGNRGEGGNGDRGEGGDGNEGGNGGGNGEKEGDGNVNPT